MCDKHAQSGQFNHPIMCHNAADLHRFSYGEESATSAVFVNADSLKYEELDLDLTFPCNDSCVSCVSAQSAKKIASKVKYRDI